MDRNGPKQTEMDRNGHKQTATDRTGRNGQNHTRIVCPSLEQGLGDGGDGQDYTQEW